MEWRKACSFMDMEMYGLFAKESGIEKNIAVLSKDFGGWKLTYGKYINIDYINIADSSTPLSRAKKIAEDVVNKKTISIEKKDKELEAKWERIYKKRCPKHYIGLSEFVAMTDAWNRRDDGFDYRREIKGHVYEKGLMLPAIIKLIQERELKFPMRVQKMICEACMNEKDTRCYLCRKNCFDKYEGKRK